ncbi:MAG: hypothetical protein KME16_19840 [Scytolyngbya sp. HA4215-MV1]|jgi:hypothetical protein|nr:hypothetical protein [Scytolyngbya sp. HA4215-MV1]
MSAKFSRLFSTAQALAPHRIEQLLTGVFFTLAVGLIASPAPAQSAEVVSAPSQVPVNQTALISSANHPQALPDGVYLYGQSSQPNQIGSAYMVIKVDRQQVAGAFYMPSSSFDCFRGELQGEKLALNIVNSYDRTSYPYALALQTNATVATVSNPAVAPTELEGYHLLETVSAGDLKILETCQASI